MKMLTENSLARLTQSFSTGFLADEVLTVLGLLQGNVQLSENQLGVLSDALDHLKQARDGFDWIKSPKVDPTAVENAFYFRRAVKALYPIVKTPMEFQKHINLLIEALEKMLSFQFVPDHENLQELKEYFSQIARAELHNSHEILSGSRSKYSSLWG